MSASSFAMRAIPVLMAVFLVFAATQQAAACACCSSVGERSELTVKLNSGHVAELERLRFERTAQLFLGEADPDSVKGIATPSDRYELDASRVNDRFVFSFRDAKDRGGTLTLARLNAISIFHVDTRQQDERPQGPALYKEWRLTAKAAGTGIFTPGLGAQQTLTLVLQGLGNNCTSPHDFTHWTLKMWGPKAKYHFFGNLQAMP
jgi:hypothetical protein